MTAPLTRLSPLHHKHVSLGAQMTSKEGWLLPEKYTDSEKELGLAFSSAGLTDVSPDSKIDVKGSQVGEFLQDLLKTEEIPSSPGDVAVVPSSAEPGLPMKYACRLARDHALLILDGPRILSETRPFSVDKIRTTRRVFLTNVSSALAGVALCGPASRGVLRGLTRLDVSQDTLPNPACSEAGLAGVQCLVVRSDAPKSGALSFHLYFGRDYAEYVWEALTVAGRSVGMAPLGTAAFARLWEGEGTDASRSRKGERES